MLQIAVAQGSAEPSTGAVSESEVPHLLGTVHHWRGPLSQLRRSCLSIHHVLRVLFRAPTNNDQLICLLSCSTSCCFPSGGVREDLTQLGFRYDETNHLVANVTAVKVRSVNGDFVTSLSGVTTSVYVLWIPALRIMHVC